MEVIKNEALDITSDSNLDAVLGRMNDAEAINESESVTPEVEAKTEVEAVSEEPVVSEKEKSWNEIMEFDRQKRLDRSNQRKEVSDVDRARYLKKLAKEDPQKLMKELGVDATELFMNDVNQDEEIDEAEQVKRDVALLKKAKEDSEKEKISKERSVQRQAAKGRVESYYKENEEKFLFNSLLWKENTSDQILDHLESEFNATGEAPSIDLVLKGRDENLEQELTSMLSTVVKYPEKYKKIHDMFSGVDGTPAKKVQSKTTAPSLNNSLGGESSNTAKKQDETWEEKLGRIATEMVAFDK